MMLLKMELIALACTVGAVSACSQSKGGPAAASADQSVAASSADASDDAAQATVDCTKIYAAGDAAASGGSPLAPVASYEGLIVAANVLKGNHQKPDYLGIPSVVFTVPPLAAVGLSERGASEQNLKFRVKTEMTSTWYSSRRVAETYSGYKVLVEEGTDRILGAHILGSEAGEVINLFALAIRSGMRATDLKHMLFAYPTSGSNITRMLN